MRAVLRSAALRVVVLAMILRALVPDGWMPNAHAATLDAMLVPCPGAGDVVALPAAHHAIPMMDMTHDLAAMPGMAHRDMAAMADMSGMHHDMAAMQGMARDASAVGMSAHAMPGLAGAHHDMAAMARHEMPPSHKAHHAATLCIFAAATAPLGSPAPDVAALPPAPPSAAVVFAASTDAPANASPYRPNAARAPPALV
jgi:hypothetical protein